MTSETKRGGLSTTPSKLNDSASEARVTTPCYQQAPRQSTRGDSHDQ